MFSKVKILIVDDIMENIRVAIGYLKDLNVHILYATSGEQAIERALKHEPHLILMDIMMPEMDGYETIQKIKQIETLSQIPVIFLTAKSEEDDIKKGFNVGGVDYITKPFNGTELLARVKTHLELSSYRRDLEEKVEERTAQIEALKFTIIEAMGTIAEYRDNETGAHIRRTKNYVKILCEELEQHSDLNYRVTSEYTKLLFEAAPMHDIGKVGINDSILLKAGKLDKEEFEQMKKHSSLGAQMIENFIQKTEPSKLLLYAKEIAAGHHEKWDGSGYPNALKGDDIPLSARIMAVADVYDALISKRIYKEAFSHDKAVGIVLEGKGSHFDPHLIEIFEKIKDKIYDISQLYKD